MNPLFLSTLIFVFLAVFVESIFLILQLKGRKLTKWLGEKAFTVHAIVTGALWSIAFLLIFLLQLEEHPLFHNHPVLRCVGGILLIGGGLLALWALKILGVQRALCLNFFKEDVPVVRGGPYAYISNPMDYGFWTALLGFALATGSLYNLAIAVEFILVMILHLPLENLPLKQD